MAKTKRRWTKALIIIGVVLLVAAIALFVCGMSAADWDFKKLSTVRYTQKEYSLEEGAQTDSIFVRYTSAHVEISYREDASNVQISYPVRINSNGEEIASVSVTFDGGALRVEEKDDTFDLFSWNLSTPTLTVILPAETECALDIDTGNGSVSVSAANAVNAPSVKVHSDNGDIAISPAGGLHVRGNAEFSSDNGRVAVEGLTAEGSVTLESDNGNIDLTNAGASAVSAETDNGNLTLTNLQVSGALTVKSENGDIRLRESVRAASFSAETDNGDIFVAEGGVLGANELTFRTDLGAIRINGALAGSQSDYTFFINTGTGSSNIPSGGSGAIRLNATTDLGDITLRFEK